MGRWEENTAKWYELKTDYCSLCGVIIPKMFWVTEVEGKSLVFCGEACEQLYRDYWLSDRTKKT